MVQRRLSLLVDGVTWIAIAQSVLLAALPESARRIELQAICIILVFLGATPMVASLLQCGLVGFNRFLHLYRDLQPFYPRCAVIVPAWNEGQVIAATIDQLLGMEYPAERLRVVVVDDASTDDTPAVTLAKAAEHPGRVVHLRREKGGQGKAHTLNHGIAWVLADDWTEALLVIDADVLLEKNALRRMTRHLSDPSVGSVTAYIKEGSPGGNYLTRLIAYEYATAEAAARRAQNVLGAMACLAGGAQLHSRENIEAIGGRIDTTTLAEDTATTFNTQLGGRRVVFEGNAVVWAEEPGSLTALWKQRLRWARGNVQISLQYLSMWGKQRDIAAGLADPLFALLWFTVVLMPLLMLGASAGLITLDLLGASVLWSVFRGLWIMHAVAYVFGTAFVLAIDTQTARRSWLQAILFPGIISLIIMAYSVFPSLVAVDAARLLRITGVVLGDNGREVLALFAYAWLALCVPCAYLAKVFAETRGLRWLAPIVIYLVGYGPFLSAVTFASYVKELQNASATWDKTEKTGRVTLGAVPR